MVAVALLLVQGCELLGPKVCPPSIDYAIQVTVLDSSTGQAPGVAAVGVLMDGAYVETMVGIDDLLTGGPGRPGTYDVEIIAPGYALWRADGIVAKPAECSRVDGIKLTAHLVPVHTVSEATTDGVPERGKELGVAQVTSTGILTLSGSADHTESASYQEWITRWKSGELPRRIEGVGGVRIRRWLLTPHETPR